MMRNAISFLSMGVSVGLIGGGAIVACSSSSGGSSVSASQAAADIANAYCARINGCSAFYVEYAAGDVATCESRFSSLFSTALGATGTGWTPSLVEACVQAFPGISCDDLLGHNLPSACRAPAGQVATGGACGDNAQCATGYCNLGAGGKCGTCAGGLGSAGAPCYRDDDCTYGTVCVNQVVTGATPVHGVCTAPGASGATCSATQPCAASLACKNGTCGKPDAAAASCSGKTCDTLAGDYCNTPAGGAGTCTKIAFAAAGQPCGSVGGTLTACPDRGVCKLATGASMGTCVAPAPDFAACDTKNGPDCMLGAECIGVPGVCTRPSPATCH